MKKIFSILTLAAVGVASTVSAFDFCNCNFKETRVDLGYTYRQDTVTYDFADPEVLPVDISEEIKLKDVGINMISGAFTVLTCDDLLFRVSGDYGWVNNSGTGTRKDFNSQTLASGPIDEWEFNVNDNFVWDVSIALGYDMTFCCDQFHVVPMVGYSWHKQKYRGSDWERETHLGVAVPEVEIAGYSETYENKWNGFWVGLDLAYVFCCDWTLFAGFEYHKSCFSGSYSFPTTTTFSDGAATSSPTGSTAANYDLNGCGHMWNVHGGINYSFCCNWNLVVAANWQQWTANDGFSEATIEGFTTHFLNTVDTKVNSWSVTAAVGYNF
jgi:hypothetical protein